MKWERKITNLGFHEMNGPDFSHNNPNAIFFFLFLTFDHLYSLCGEKFFLFHTRVLKESFLEYIYDFYNFNFTITIL